MAEIDLLSAPIKHAPNGSRVRDHDCEFSERLAWPQPDGSVRHGGRCPDCRSVFIRTGVIGGTVVTAQEYRDAQENRKPVKVRG